MRTTDDDLTKAAAELRGDLRDTLSNQPAREPGQRLGALPRGDKGEIRITWDDYKGRHFLSIRLWAKNSQGDFRPSQKGVTVRIHEMPDFADAVAKGIELAKDQEDTRSSAD